MSTNNDDGDLSDYDSDFEEEAFNASTGEIKAKLLLGVDSVKSQGLTSDDLNNFIKSYVELSEDFKKIRAEEMGQITRLSQQRKYLEDMREGKDRMKDKIEELDRSIVDKKKEMNMTSHNLKIAIDTHRELEKKIEEDLHNVKEMKEKADNYAKSSRKMIKQLLQDAHRNEMNLKDDIFQCQKDVNSRHARVFMKKDRIEMFKKDVEELYAKIKVLKESLRHHTEDLYKKKNTFLSINENTRTHENDYANIKKLMDFYASKRKEHEIKQNEYGRNRGKIEKELLKKSTKIDELKLSLESLAKTSKQEYDYNKQLLMMQNLLAQSVVETRRSLDKLKEKVREERKNNKEMGRDFFKKATAVKNFQDNIKLLKQTLGRLREKEATIKRDLESNKEKTFLTQELVDITLKDYLDQEDQLSDVVTGLKKTKMENQNMEGKLGVLKHEFVVKRRENARIDRNRNKLALELNQKKNEFIGIINRMKQRKFQNEDLAKNLREIQKKNRALQNRYENFKIERNNYAAEIHKHRSDIVQIETSLGILKNEEKVLTQKVLKKESELLKARKVSSRIIEVTDKQKCTLSEMKMKVNNEMNQINDTENKVKQLNSVIGGLENEMHEIDKQIENNVTNRNLVGLSVMDKNDEVILLCEKLKVLTTMSEEGESKLNYLDDDVKRAQLQLRDTMLHLESTVREVANVDALKKEKKQLTKEIEQTESVLQDLVVVQENKNIKVQSQTDFEESLCEEKLMGEIKDLENLLSEKEDAILEKNIILQGLTKSTDKLRHFLLTRRKENFTLSTETNSLQVDIHRMNRKLKSLFAELSLYQTNQMKLEVENDQLRKYAEKLKGMKDPPLEIIKEIEQRKRFLNQKQNFVPEETGASRIRSTAVKRPNCYVDPHSGLPRPYVHPPILPTNQGRSFHHFSKLKTQILNKKEKVYL